MTRAHMRGMVRHFTLYVLLAAVAAGLGLWAAQNRFATPPPSPAPSLRSVTLFPGTRSLPPWRLDGSDGKPVTPATLHGHWTLVYLGFTRCPDVCPTTLQTLGMARKSWAALPVAVRPLILFVSVDPAHDTPARTGEYAHYFGNDILAATANEKAVADFAHALGMVFMKVPTSGGDYTIDHSASVSVIDPAGRMAGLIRPPFDARAIGGDLATLVGSIPGGSR